MWLFHCAREQFVNSPLRWCWWWWVRSGWTASCTPYNWKPSLRPFYLSRIAHKFRRTIHATSVSVSVRNDCQCATIYIDYYCVQHERHAARARRRVPTLRMRPRAHSSHDETTWTLISILTKINMLQSKVVYMYFLVFVAVATAVLRPSEGQAECSCKNHTLCQPLSTKPYKEVLAFVVNQVGECPDLRT